MAALRDFFGGPWVVPARQPVELFFFQKVFMKLCKTRQLRAIVAAEASVAASTHGHPSTAFLWHSEISTCRRDEGLEDVDQVVPLVEFDRAMVRLSRVIGHSGHMDVSKYDIDGDGFVSWFEFCCLWRDGGVCARLSLAERIFLTIEDPSLSKLGRLVSILVFIAILVSIAIFVMTTLQHPSLQDLCPLSFEDGFDETCRPRPKKYFETIDFVCIMFFSVEYGLRLVLSPFVRLELCDRDRARILTWVTSDEVAVVPGPFRRIAEFVVAPSNLVDLFAIMPWYLEQFIDQGRSNAIIQLIRLTRVIRAFRLGRRLEAVIIIMRSLKRSFRALRVLMLNLFLGMLIFGSLMYMAEQGEWDPENKYFVREIDRIWDDEARVWQRVMARSPFDSIPACFWWAVVTATTVGYGDDYTPTTPMGKLVASVTMVWALCVLALPIGVIGGNFEKVWEQYDFEKREEAAIHRRQEAINDQSRELVDPLHIQRTLVFQVWHDTGLPRQGGDGNQAEFLGETECILDLTPTYEVTSKRVTGSLQRNPTRARNQVRGQLHFEYSWRPSERKDQDSLLVGRLQISDIRAEGLMGVDWCEDGLANPYVVVIARPRISDDGEPAREAHRTSTVPGTTRPLWNSSIKFNFDWTRSGADTAFKSGMRRALATSEDMSPQSTMRPAETRADTTSPSSLLSPMAGEDGTLAQSWRLTEVTPLPPCTDEPNGENAEQPPRCVSFSNTTEDFQEILRKRRPTHLTRVELAVPELVDEVDRLKRLVPKLHADVGSVVGDLDWIFAALQQQQRQQRRPG